MSEVCIPVTFLFPCFETKVRHGEFETLNDVTDLVSVKESPSVMRFCLFRNVPFRYIVQLYCGWGVHGPGHATSECGGGLWRSQGLHYPSRHRSVPV